MIASFSPAWTAAGWTMLHLVWVGGLLGAAGLILRFLLRAARPEARYDAALLCLSLLAVAPFVLFCRVYRPPHAESEDPIRMAIVRDGASLFPQSGALPRWSRTMMPMTPTKPPVESAPAASFLDSLAARLPWLWLAGSTTTLGFLAIGLAGVRRLRSSGRTPIDDAISLRAAKLADSLGVARRFTLGVCDRLTSPVLLGILRPMILLPPSALSGWTADELEMALLHEIAHLRRHDNLVNLLQCIIESLLFFHPATWWLSSWVRLEREHCCDRLVVEKTGRSRAYAEMLAAMVGIRGRPGLSALAERPLISRIRNILNTEDRPMRLTLKEGLGLIAMAVVAGAMAIGAQAKSSAGDDKPKSDDALRKTTLRTIATQAASAKLDGSVNDNRGDVLLGIASAQFKIGDRDAAESTVREACKVLAAIGEGAKKPRDITAVITLSSASKVYREAGERDSARKALDQATKLLMELNDPGARDVLKKYAKEVQDEAEGIAPDDLAGLMLAHLATEVIDERIKLGDLEEARRLISWSRKISENGKGEIMAYLDAALGSQLVRTGDKQAGLALIRKAISRPDSAQQFKGYLAQTLAESGELDEAFALYNGEDKAALAILHGVKEYDGTSGFASYDISGIKILIGAEGSKPKASAAMLRGLAVRLRDLKDAKIKARSLSTVAHLLAMSGEFKAATEAAEAIPAITRGDFAGASDGFYDSVKPGTFALIAARMAKAGDRAGAAAMFDRSEASIRAMKRNDEAMIARIVLAESLADAGDKLAVSAAVREAAQVAKALPEPRRSRGLSKLVAIQAGAGDPNGAVAMVDAIRPYPGVEKMRALSVLSHTFEKNGDEANARAMARMATDCKDVKKPDGFKLGPAMNLNAFGADTFIDPDLEVEEPMAKFECRQMAENLQAKATTLAEAEKAARAKPPVNMKGAWGGPGMALGSIATSLAYKGEYAEALRIVASIEDSHDRLWSYEQVARAIRDSRKD